MHVTALFCSVFPLMTFFSPLQTTIIAVHAAKSMQGKQHTPVLSDGIDKGDIVTLSDGYLCGVGRESQSSHLVTLFAQLKDALRKVDK